MVKRKGIKVDKSYFSYVSGLFRLAVIAQQIYFRFFHGQTKDERFGHLIFAILILETQAKIVMEPSNL
jgi:aminoglycoside phosphotransferase (APT) family kinase protein